MNEVLKLLRIANNYKPKELADLLGVSQSFLSQLENGLKKPSNELLNKYSKIFKVRVSTLHFFAEEKEDKNLKYQQLLLMILKKICEKKNVDI